MCVFMDGMADDWVILVLCTSVPCLCVCDYYGFRDRAHRRKTFGCAPTNSLYLLVAKLMRCLYGAPIYVHLLLLCQVNTIPLMNLSGTGYVRLIGAIPLGAPEIGCSISA